MAKTAPSALTASAVILQECVSSCTQGEPKINCSQRDIKR